MKAIEVDDKIDITAIFKTLWKNRKWYAITLVSAGMLGAVIALSIPNTYKSKIILAPELGNNSFTDKFSGLASMVGLNLGNVNASVDAFYPMIYPNVLESTPFVAGLFDVKVTLQKGDLKNITLYDYLTKHQKSSIFLSVPSLFKSSKLGGKHTPVTDTQGVLKLSKQQQNVKNAINGMLSCNVDKRTDIITISVVSQDPLVSATLVDTVAHRLQQYIIKYRTSKASSDLDYALTLQKEAKQQFEDAQQLYTSYADRHLDAVFETPRQRAKELENDMSLKYQIYTQITQQVQIARAKVQERTPAFTVIEPAVVPVQKNGPARTIIVLGFMFVAFIGTSLWALAKK